MYVSNDGRVFTRPIVSGPVPRVIRMRIGGVRRKRFVRLLSLLLYQSYTLYISHPE